ncbi:EamA family transporter [Catalinimonas niigatensis]|uniref:EamA family transporter n=1 Tax=Catalinimonas niigatensis TaxID=1397264 RepID=UPI0026667489|nr:EamA family transporter [Catalinimonas niigatensis]WPP49107.1 EamA family transporter [Catalinimonas niigatensis]
MSKALLTKLLAYFMIYIVWGSNFIAIAFAIQSIPPFLTIALRFLLAGLFFFLISKRGNYSLAVCREGVITGFFLNILGTGALAWSVQYIPSGVAAVIVAAIPIWMILLDFGSLQKNLRNPRLVIALLLGVSSILLISLTRGSFVVATSSTQFFLSLTVLIGGTLAWSYGSLYSKRLPARGSLIAFLAVQMTSAGAGLLVISLMIEELHTLNLTVITQKSWLALLYLIVFGSILGYLSYVWLLRNVEPVKVGFYALVNPVIAIFLGWWLADEIITPSILAGTSFVLLAVLLIHARQYSRIKTTAK